MIPAMLEKRIQEAEEMGLKARQAWETFFRKEVCFHHIAEACKTLHENRRKRDMLLWLRIYIQFLRPYHTRNLLRIQKNRFKKLF